MREIPGSRAITSLHLLKIIPIQSIQTPMQKRILIYDDELEILKICQLVLKKQNYQVEVRASCQDIVSDVELIRPDLILMDLWIPENGGVTATAILKNNQQLQHIPVILFSADNSIKLISHQIKAEGYLEKPFDIKMLIAIIEQYIL